MSLVGFKAENHPQQVGKVGAKDHIDDRATTPEMFARLDDRFDFTVDVAASEANAKCARYFTKEDDGLKQSWAGERVWCNPPFSDIRPWVQKAWDSWNGVGLGLSGALRFAMGDGRPELVVMLVPANRTEQKWWQELVEPWRDRPRSPLRVDFLPGRPRFIRVGSTGIGPNERPPFGCCLLIWGER